MAITSVLDEPHRPRSLSFPALNPQLLRLNFDKVSGYNAVILSPDALLSLHIMSSKGKAERVILIPFSVTYV